MRTVALRHFGYLQRPLNAQPRIGHIESAFCLLHVGRRVEIDELTIGRQCLKTVGKPFRDEQTATILGAQDLGMPLQECRRIASQVHSNIEYLSAQATHQLDLCMRWMLIMHAAHGTRFGRVGVVDLLDRLCEAKRRELLRAIESAEKAAGILDRIALHDG